MRELDAQGTAWEVGYAIGAAAPELVRAAIDVICRFSYSEETLSRLAAIRERLADTFPQALEEAAGLAAGAGIREQDALALSVSPDLTGELPGWCSLVAVAAETGLLVAKNLDAPAQLGRLQVLQRVSRAGSLRFAHVTTAGAMWTDGGINEAGLALVNASLASVRINGDGVPDGILAREVLAACASVPEAISFATALPVRTLGENLLLADAHGESCLVSLLPRGHAIERATKVAACNHVLDKTLEAEMSANDPLRANSHDRYRQLVRRVSEPRTWVLGDLERILLDPHGGVRQGRGGPIETVASVAIAPKGRRLWVADAESDWRFVEVRTGWGSGSPAEAGSYMTSAADSKGGGR
jgi:hypothetical protein